MKKLNLIAASVFIAALVVGASLVGVGAKAQTITPVVCSNANTVVAVGNLATFAVSGGNGSYIWSIPGVIVPNSVVATTTFKLAFNVPGNYMLSVTSAGTVSTCRVSVTAVEAADPGGPIAPGLPNTGELN